VPVADRDRFHDWSSAVAASLDRGQGDEVQARGAEAREALADYFTALIAARRAQPQPDLVSHLVAVTESGDRMSLGELLSMCSVLLSAGHETTVNLIANGVLSLLRNPEQLALLRSRPELLARAVEELARYESPVQLTARVVLEDVELGGVLMRRGEQ